MRSISPRKIYKRYELSNREDRKCWAIKQVHVYISFVLFYIRFSTVYHLYYFTYVSLLCNVCWPWTHCTAHCIDTLNEYFCCCYWWWCCCICCDIRRIRYHLCFSINIDVNGSVYIIVIAHVVWCCLFYCNCARCLVLFILL